MSIDTGLTYRTTGPWGPGTGVDLVNSAPDNNFWILIQNDEYLLALVNSFITTPPTSISDFIVAGDQFYVQLTNSTMLGPFQLPSALWTVVPGGVWTPNTAYALNSVFTTNGTVYLVIFPYPGAPTFDPGANDGHGHNYFSPILTVPDNFLPSGGFNGQALTVIHPGGSGIPSTQWDYLLPVGGVTNTFLKLVTPGSPTSPPTTIWGAVTGGDIADLSLESLDDVLLTPPLTVGQSLTWNVGGFWTNEFVGGSHGHGSIALEDLTDYFTTSPVRIGDVVTWDGDAWTNAFPDVSVERLSDYNAYSPLEVGDVLTYIGGGWSNRPGVFGIQKTTVRLTSAELKNLATTAIEIVPAQGANTIIVITESYYVYNYGTITYIASGAASGLFYGFTDNELPADNGDTGFLTDLTNSAMFVGTGVDINPVSPPFLGAGAVNVPVYYFNFGGPYENGDGTVVLTVLWTAVPST